MSQAIHLKLMLEPVAKGRPRVSRQGRVYTPAKTAAFERDIQLLTQHLNPMGGALTLKACFVCKRPKSLRSAGGERVPKVTRPDIDNYLKALLDGLNGSVFEDDAQLVELAGSKFYAAKGEDPHIQVEVMAFEGGVDAMGTSTSSRKEES